MSSHTPGPWREVGIAMKVFADNMCICDIRGWGYLTGIGGLHLPEAEAVEIQRANTRLIVAAPELLTAAKAVMHACDMSNAIDGASWRLLRAAIARAEGR